MGFFSYGAFYQMKEFPRGWMHELFVHFEELGCRVARVNRNMFV